MAKYRKKPVVIEAIQFFEDEYRENTDKYPMVVDMAMLTELYFGKTAKDGRYYILTLEGSMTVSEGDFIIKGVDDEFYPCKPDIFEKTYEKVGE